MSQGPNTFPYFSPTVPFGVYITNLNGPSLVLTPPTVENNPFQIIKTTANINKMYIANSVESTTFGLDANGDARWSSTGNQAINGDNLRIDTGNGIQVGTTSGLPLQLIGNTNDVSLQLSKTFADINTIQITNSVGDLKAGLFADGSGHIDSQKGLKLFNATGTSLQINTPAATSGTSVEILKSAPNSNNVFVGNSLGFTQYGVIANGETQLTSTLRNTIITPKLDVTTGNGVLISPPTLNTLPPLEVQGNAVVNETAVFSKSSATKNIAKVSNSLGVLEIGVAATTGRGLLDANNGLSLNNVTGTSLEIKTPTAEPYGLRIIKDTNANLVSRMEIPAGSIEMTLLTGGETVFGNSGQLNVISDSMTITSSDSNKLRIVGFTAGNLISDVSGNITVGSLLPPASTFYGGGGVGTLPLGIIFPAVPNARYHRITAVGAGGGGGRRFNNCSAGGGGGAATAVLIVRGNTLYNFTIPPASAGATVVGTRGANGIDLQISASSGTGVVTCQGGGGGGFANEGGNVGDGGGGGTASLDGGTFPWLLGYDPMLLKQSGGDGQSGNNFFQQGILGGGTIVCPPGGGADNGGASGFNAPIGSGRGGGGGTFGSGNGGNGGSGSITIETFY